MEYTLKHLPASCRIDYNLLLMIIYKRFMCYFIPRLPAAAFKAAARFTRAVASIIEEEPGIPDR